MSQWQTELQSNETYHLVSVYSPSSKVLDITGENVDIYTDTGGSYLEFTIERIQTGEYKGLYYIKQGALFVTEDSNYNVKVSNIMSEASVWSFVAVEKKDADIYSFNYSYIGNDNEVESYDSTGNNDYYVEKLTEQEYDAYAFINTSESHAYRYLRDFDDIFVFRGHGMPGMIGFFDSQGEFIGEIALVKIK